MTQVFASEVTIARPPEDVWTALTDWEQAHRWMKVDSIAGDGETTVGTVLTFRARGKDRLATIAAVEPERSVMLRSVQGRVTADYTYEVEPIDADHARVLLVAECSTTGPVWKLLSPLLRSAIRRTDGKQLEALKEHVEEGGS